MYSAYLHSNGTVQVKFCPGGKDLISEEDLMSPFVQRHLGYVEADSYLEAKKLFEEKIKEN